MITVRVIVTVVANVCDVTESDIYGPMRHRTICRARQLVMWVARAVTDKSFTEIGRALGRRDHSTVMHGEACIKSLIDSDARWRADADLVLSCFDEPRAKAAREALKPQERKDAA